MGVRVNDLRIERVLHEDSPMSWLSSFVNDLTGSSATDKAVNAQTTATEGSLDLQREQFDRSIEIMQPWLDAGGNALNQQRNLLGISDLTRGPDETYADVLERQRHRTAGAMEDYRNSGFAQTMSGQTDYTMNALTGNAAASGMSLSGSHLKDLYDTARRDDNTAFNQYYNALAGTSGSGQVAAGNTQQAGQSYANNSSNLMMNQSNALSSAYQQQGQTTSGLFRNALGGAAGWFFGGDDD